MRFSRHAKNEMRLYKMNPFDVVSAVRKPVHREKDDRGNSRLLGPGCDGRAIIVVVAKDDPDFVITAFPEV
jgi:hypothetical protein